MARRNDARGTGANGLSIVGAAMRVTGDIASDGAVHVDGTVTGDISATSVRIGRTGTIEGIIRADTVEVSGRVTGNIEARAVTLGASARLAGDTYYDTLAIEAGAQVEGRTIPRTAVPGGGPVQLRIAH